MNKIEELKNRLAELKSKENNKMTEEEQMLIISVIKACFE